MSEENPVLKLYNDPKSKKFVNHLITSYIPVHKSTKVLEFNDKKEHKCSVCNHDLIDATTVIQRMYNSQDYMKDTTEQIFRDMKGEKTPKEDRAIIKHVTHGAIMAWTGEKTDTYLCLNCIESLLEMVMTGLLNDDKNLIWITNKMRRDEIFTQFKENPALEVEEKQKVEQIQKIVEKKKVITFGDLEVLQQLKAKMEAEENNE